MMSKGSNYQRKQLLVVERPLKLMKPEESEPLIIRNRGLGLNIQQLSGQDQPSLSISTSSSCPPPVVSVWDRCSFIDFLGFHWPS